jgi:hypothetical protein
MIDEPRLLGAGDIAERIFAIRARKVMLDADLAALYGVTTKRLNEQVRRNPGRFPPDFMFPLSNQEVANLRSHLATSSWGGRRRPPIAFTEHGALMAASVPNSPRAIEASLYVVRAFVSLRDMLAAHRELADRLDALERRLASHDEAIVGVVAAIRKLMETPASRKRPIGFVQSAE